MTNTTEVIAKLRMAQVSSCACLTKTNEASYHDADCLYRVLSEAISAITTPSADHCEDALGMVETSLVNHCKQCAEVVRTWPESKRDCLGKIGPVVERQPFNQCDGCRAGKPLVHGNLHVMIDANGYQDLMACTAHLYAVPPELAELQATIERLRAELAAMCRLWPEDMSDDGSGRIGWQQHVVQTVIKARATLSAGAEPANKECAQ